MRIAFEITALIVAGVVAAAVTDLIAPLPFHAVAGQTFSGSDAERWIHVESIRHWLEPAVFVAVSIGILLIKHRVVIHRRRRFA
jgi:hypothetical protein